MSHSATTTRVSKWAPSTVRSIFHLVSRGEEGPKLGANVNPASERPETPPPPTIVIPFTRDADFVERGVIFDQLHQRCAGSGSQTALVGLGGVG